MPDPATIAAVVSAGTGLFNVGRSLLGQPDFPLTDDDINRSIDLSLNRALSDASSTVRRQLVGAGQEGSGTIARAVADQQARVRTFFEEQRQKALNLAKSARFGAQQGQFNQVTDILGQLSGTAFSGALLLGGQQDVQGQDFGGLENLLNRQILQSQGVNPNLSGLGINNATTLGQPQAVQPRGLQSGSQQLSPVNVPRLNFNG